MIRTYLKARTRITAFASALMLGVLSVAAVPTPVAAHNYLGWGWCNGSPALCVSTDANGYGDKLYLNATGQGFCRNINSTFNDRISGIDSHIGVQAYFWKDANCNGARYNYCPAWCTVNNLSGSGYNDTFTAYCIGTSSQSSCGYWF
jgi:hypothetical protein